MDERRKERREDEKEVRERERREERSEGRRKARGKKEKGKRKEGKMKKNVAIVWIPARQRDCQPCTLISQGIDRGRTGRAKTITTDRKSFSRKSLAVYSGMQHLRPARENQHPSGGHDGRRETGV
ncbi:hypothetical protein Pmani_020583 [Petrolisthes manimaculis]|uniref:Uncharacterized protein n=1 Tax=Petrolisthes manimaculis TaxID=1843537 RepID=A0AAE1PGG7_9EUCA|nr:hypothetical protein Pmani_020583 [Petrolisthes manimaculis]